MAAGSYRLVVRTGPNPGVVYDLTKEVALLGRDVNNDIVLGDAEVSRQHSRLTRTPGGYVLEDLGSTNGTFVNGERLVAPRVLSGGDMLGLGENVTLVFESSVPQAAATVAAAPSARPMEPPAYASPQRQPAYTPPPAYAPAAAEPMAPAAPGGARAKPWIIAGCGCLLVAAACGAVLWFMPASWWEAVLRVVGF
jgi:predicted component of type VI protein secretion system